MAKRNSLKKFLKSFLFGVMAAFIFLFSSGASNSHAFSDSFTQENDHLEILKKIYDEVKELGTYPHENFINRDFFIGSDDDDTNKDQHVVVLIQKVDEIEEMKIQVTYLERSKENPKVKYAKDVKNIACFIVRNKVKIQRSDYDEEDIERLVPQILRAILDKKKLLKEFE